MSDLGLEYIDETFNEFAPDVHLYRFHSWTFTKMNFSKKFEFAFRIFLNNSRLNLLELRIEGVDEYDALDALEKWRKELMGQLLIGANAKKYIEEAISPKIQAAKNLHRKTFFDLLFVPSLDLTKQHYLATNKEVMINDLLGYFSTDEKLPEDGQSVIVLFGEYGKDIVKFRKGISIKERKDMQDGILPDPEVEFFSTSFGETVRGKRSGFAYWWDEAGNNLKPYGWENPPKRYNGQDIKFWKPAI